MSDAPSEKTQAKAAEYLLSGRIKVRYLSGTNDAWGAEFTAMSASQEPGEPYHIRAGSGTGWHCDCPARVMVCAHILACRTITDFPWVEPTVQSEVKPLPRSEDIDALLSGLG